MTKQLLAGVCVVTASLAFAACGATPAEDSPEIAAASVASTRWDKGATGVSDGVPPGREDALPRERPQ